MIYDACSHSQREKSPLSQRCCAAPSRPSRATLQRWSPLALVNSSSRLTCTCNAPRPWVSPPSTTFLVLIAGQQRSAAHTMKVTFRTVQGKSFQLELEGSLKVRSAAAQTRESRSLSVAVAGHGVITARPDAGTAPLVPSAGWRCQGPGRGVAGPGLPQGLHEHHLPGKDFERRRHPGGEQRLRDRFLRGDGHQGAWGEGAWAQRLGRRAAAVCLWSRRPD